MITAQWKQYQAYYVEVPRALNPCEKHLLIVQFYLCSAKSK